MALLDMNETNYSRNQVQPNLKKKKEYDLKLALYSHPGYHNSSSKSMVTNCFLEVLKHH